MNELITIKNVRGRIGADGNPELNLEDIARGLGFTELKNEVQYVMWRRVRKHLVSFGTCAEKDDLPEFIPINIFYKLCLKAENEIALKFQDVVTDEILPSIQKHGGYLTPAKLEEVLLNPDTLIQLATNLKAEQDKNKKLQAVNLDLSAKNQIMEPKALFADAVAASHTSILVGDLAKLLKQNGVKTGQKRLFEWLRENGYLIKRKGVDRNMPTQRSMEMGLFEIKESTVNNPDGSVRINRTTKVTGRGQQYFINKFLAA